MSATDRIELADREDQAGRAYRADGARTEDPAAPPGSVTGPVAPTAAHTAAPLPAARGTAATTAHAPGPVDTPPQHRRRPGPTPDSPQAHRAADRRPAPGAQERARGTQAVRQLPADGLQGLVDVG